MSKSGGGPDFEKWMEEVDALVYKRAGLSVHDLPDCPFLDWFNDDVMPGVAARRAIRRMAREEGD